MKFLFHDSISLKKNTEILLWKLSIFLFTQFWDDRLKHSVRRLYGPHICGDSLDIDPQHNHILTGSWRKDKVLQVGGACKMDK